MFKVLRNVYCGTYFTHVQTCNVTRVQSATECILWYILYTCPNLQQPTTLEASLRHPWTSLRAMKASSPLQAPFKHPSRWSPLQAPLKPASSFLQAEGFKPPSSPLEAPEKMKPPSSPLQAPSKPLQRWRLEPPLKPPWSPLQGEAPLKPPWSPLEGFRRPQLCVLLPEEWVQASFHDCSWILSHLRMDCCHRLHCWLHPFLYTHCWNDQSGLVRLHCWLHPFLYKYAQDPSAFNSTLNHSASRGPFNLLLLGCWSWF